MRYLTKQDYYNEINNPNTLCAFIGGSRAINIIDENSDWDIIFVQENTEKPISINVFYLPGGTKVDFIKINKNNFYNKYVSSFWRFNYLISFKLLKKNPHYILYSKKEDNFLNNCLENEDILFKKGLLTVYEVQQSLFKEIISEKDILKTRKNKIYYRLIFFKKILFNEEIDVKYLTSVKWMKHKGIEHKYVDYITKDLEEFCEYMNKNSLEIEQNWHLFEEAIINGHNT